MSHKNCHNCKYWARLPAAPCISCITGKAYSAPTNWEAGPDYIPMTNADRIRAMSDEELAKWLCEFDAEAFAAGALKYGAPIMNERERLDWLRQPAEEEPT